MADPIRWSNGEMLRLAARGVLKVDLLGHRGTTLLTCEGAAAMAGVLVASGGLPLDLLKPENLKKDA